MLFLAIESDWIIVTEITETGFTKFLNFIITKSESVETNKQTNKQKERK
jgi:hypothetical protein